MRYTQKTFSLFEKGKDGLKTDMEFLWDKRRNGVLSVFYFPLHGVKKK